MFKKFDEKESVSGVTQLKSSVQKNIRAKIVEAFPHIEKHIEEVLPKKDAFRIVKWLVNIHSVSRFLNESFLF